MGTYAGRARLAVGIVLALAWTSTASPALADQNESGSRPLQQGALTVGFGQACAVSAAGDVRCWGSDNQGQVGDGGGTASKNAVPSSAVALGAPATAVSAGNSSTCALLLGGAVRCWGDDGAGQLGDGSATTAGSNGPVGAVNLGQPATAITLGAAHACALLRDQTVRCWGRDSYGELGDGGSTAASNDAPVAPVSLGQPVRAVAAGGAETCALLADGSVRCWGYGSDGEMGDSTTGVVNAAPRGAVPLGQAARALSAGSGSVCALLVDGAVRCWGSDGNGQLGDGGTTAAINASPGAAITLGQAATAITVDGNAACALLADATIRCWGYNAYGNLGDGLPANSAVPSTVVALGQPARAVTAGGLGMCATLASGGIRCWGYDADGELGDGGTTTTVNSVPGAVVNLPAPPSADSADLALTATTTTTSAVVGDTVTVTLTLTSSGPDASTAQVAAPLGAGLTPLSATPSQGSYSSATGLWKVGTIAPGGSAALVLSAKVIAPGTSVTTAEIVDASAQDPDSTPGNDDLGEDDRATVAIPATAIPSVMPGDIVQAAAIMSPGLVAPAVVPRGAVPAKGQADRLTLAFKSTRDARAPFVFSPKATMLVTKSALATACAGTVTFSVTAGTRVVLIQRAPLRLVGGSCSSSTQMTIRKRPGTAKKLIFAASFSGNATTQPIASPKVTARIT